MDKSKEKEKLMDLIVDAKREDPETGSFTEWLAGFLLDHGVVVPADDGPGADRLRELIQADRYELRYEPTFKIGDSVWQTDGIDVFELKVKRLLYDCGHVAFDESAVGKRIFKTSAEAETAMAKAKEAAHE